MTPQGCVATLSTKANDRVLRRQVHTAESYGAASPPRIHFGLGQCKTLTNIQATWPNSQTESFGALASGQIHTLQRAEGCE